MPASKVVIMLVAMAAAGALPSVAGAQEPPLVAAVTAAVPAEPADAGPVLPDQQPAPPVPTPRHTGVHEMFRQLGADFKNLPAKENVLWAAAGGGLAAAVHPWDDDVNEAMLNASSGVKDAFKPGAVMGQ